MIRRRLIGPGAAIALALTCIVGGTSADAAPRGAACVLSGSATITPGLTTAARTVAVKLSNVTLKNCRSGNSSSPSTAVSTGTVTTSPNPAYITASCAKGNLALSATIAWSTGQSTTATVKTTGLAANQAIQGKVTGGNNPSLRAGDLLAGDVAFKPTTTAQNCAKVPVTAVTFQGALAAGSPS
jgi:hypothetical protein